MLQVPFFTIFQVKCEEEDGSVLGTSQFLKYPSSMARQDDRRTRSGRSPPFDRESRLGLSGARRAPGETNALANGGILLDKHIIIILYGYVVIVWQGFLCGCTRSTKANITASSNSNNPNKEAPSCSKRLISGAQALALLSSSSCSLASSAFAARRLGHKLPQPLTLAY